MTRLCFTIVLPTTPNVTRALRPGNRKPDNATLGISPREYHILHNIGYIEYPATGLIRRGAETWFQFKIADLFYL